MKHFLLSALILCSLLNTAFGQKLFLYTDTIHKFKVALPVGWQCGVPKDKSAILMAVIPKTDSNKIGAVVFRINIFHQKETDLNRTYQEFLATISKNPGFVIINQLQKVIHNRSYKYLVERHLTETKADLASCNLLANNRGEIFILVMTAGTADIRKYQNLFHRVADSLQY